MLRQFDDDHERDASPTQRAIEAASLFFGSPAYFVGAVAFAILWLALDGWESAHGWLRMEDPPYFGCRG